MLVISIVGYVTHATDRPLWSLRAPVLKPDQIELAQKWITTVETETRAIAAARRPLKGVREVLTLKEDKTIGWVEDVKYDEILRLAQVLPGE